MSMFTRLLSGTILSLICISASYAQIHYDSGYSRRNGSLGHYYKMVGWNDNSFREFAMWQENSSNFMNWRAIFPPGYDKNNPQKYPMIVMLHGAGESGRAWTGRYNYATSDPRYDNNGHNILWGGQEHLQAVNRNPTHPRAFPGIVIWPQVSYNGAWGAVWNNGSLGQTGQNVASIVEHMIQEYNVNEFKIYVHGLSNGAKGTWDQASKRPDLYAAGAPMSGTGDNRTAQNSILVTMPWWVFQGGLDANPNPTYTQSWIDDLVARGGKPRYTLYPNTGHGTWFAAYQEPDFFSWLLAQDKRNIFVFGELPTVCNGTPVQFGFSAGFLGYQWRRNGVDIPGATGRFYTTSQPGIYTVRFLKRTDNQWTESFPVNLCADADTEPPTVPANLAITSIGFTEAVADWDASTDNTEVTGYEVFLNGVSYGTTTDTELALTGLTISTNYSVQVRAFDGSGNYSVLTSSVNFATDSDTEAPTIPVNIVISDIGDYSATVTWTASSDNLGVAGYDVYLDGELLETTSETSFALGGLSSGTTYNITIRAFDISGNYSALSSPTEFTTTIDTEAPSVPQNILVSNISSDGATVSWDASTDNYGVDRYEVFIDGLAFGSTSGTSFDLTGLASETEYIVTVRAVDINNLYSDLSAGTSFTTLVTVTGENGLLYTYYQSSVSWPSSMPDFSSLTPVATGTVDNFDIYAVRQQNDRFAIVFEGYIQISQAGLYTFYTNSDNGSILYIDGALVVDNDGLHSLQEASGTYTFDNVGFYPIRVEYYEQYGPQDLFVDYQPSGGVRVAIPDEVLFQSISSGSSMMSTLALTTPTVYPNPFSSSLTIDLNDTNVTEVILYDLMDMQMEVFPVNSNASSISLDLGHIPTGTYVIGVGTERIRIIKL